MYVLGLIDISIGDIILLLLPVLIVFILIVVGLIIFTSSGIGVITSYVKKEKREPLFKSPIIPILLVIDFLIILVIVLLLVL